MSAPEVAAQYTGFLIVVKLVVIIFSIYDNIIKYWKRICTMYMHIRGEKTSARLNN